MSGLSEAMRKKLSALGALEGLPEIDEEVSTPMGPARLTRAPLRPAMDEESLPVAAPVSSLGAPAVPRYHDKPAGTRDEELEAATELDASDRSRLLFETATRQLIGGLTRTPTVASLSLPGTAQKDLLSKRRAEKMDALRQLEAGSAADRALAYGKSVDAGIEGGKMRSETETERQKLERERMAQAAKLAADRDALEREKMKQRGAPKAAKPVDDRAPKGFPAGWELEGKTQPTPKQGEEFEKLVYSGEKMKGLATQMKELVKTSGAKRFVPGTAEHSRVKQLATEIMIEGKNVAELGALSGPDMGLMQAIAADPTTLGSAMKDMPSLLDGLASWADNSVKAKSVSLGARRKGGPAAAPDDEDAAALKWARANRDNPDAKKILALHGEK